MSQAPSSERSASTRLVLITLIAAAILLVPAGFVRASGANGTLHGYITNSATSAAVVGATVRVTASDVNWVVQASTDASGFYTVSLPNHQYSVQVSAPAYDVNSTSVNIGSAETVWNNMSLTPASSRTAVVQGLVTDSVSSAAVTVGQVVASTVWWSSEDYTNSSSMNATGFYRMYLVPGTYQLSTSGIQGYAPYTSTYLYPSGGSTLWWNISLTPSPLVAWINGTVEDSWTYATIAGATLTASVGALQLAPVQSNATGAFSVQVPIGTIAITGDAAGHAPNSVTVYVYSAGSHTTNLYLSPLSASERGWIRDGLTGAPIAGARFTATPFWSTGYFDEATTKAGGYFQLNLTADDFDLSATATGYTAWAGYDFLSTGEIAWRNVTLWPIISPVQGYVLDGSTGAHLSGIYVYAYDSRSGYSTYSLSDITGFYSFLLPPSPAILLRVYGTAPYAGVVAYPDVRAYVTTWANLTLPRLNAALDVTVTDGLTGLPISPAYVNAYWTNGYDYGITNVSGFTVVAVPAGFSLTLGVSASGYLSVYSSLDPFSGTQALSVALYPSLTTNVTVQGYVVDASTLLPLSSARVQATGYGGSSPYGYTNATGYYTFSIVAKPQTLRATAWRYAEGSASVSPTTAGTLWVNFTLPADTTAPRILNFTATPENNVGPGNPTTLQATVNETSLSVTYLSILKLRSSASGTGTFLSVGAIPAGNISLTPTTRGNSSMTSVYDTRTPITILSDGVSTTWWPDSNYWYPFQDVVAGTFQNATLSSPVSADAVFDVRDGRLLYVATGANYIDPIDQPTATFTPTALGYQLNLSTAAILGYALVTGPTFQIGSLAVSLTKTLSSGEYAALLEAYDAGNNYGRGATFFNVTADTTPPVARAGPNQTVNQGTTVTLDGTASTDNMGITGYTWTFTDGTLQVLHGAIVHHGFANAGVYHVTLTVIDAAGNSATSAMTVTVLDTTPPTVAFTTPAAGATVSESIVLTATAFDNVGVVRVEFLADGVLLGNATSIPYTLAFNTTSLSNGNHTLEVIAYDAAGNRGSASRQVDVQNTAPTGGAGSLLGVDASIWIVLVLVLAAVGAAIVFVVARRKKPRAPMTTSPEAMGTIPPPPGAP